jgi:hypothetical protein
VLWLWVIVEMLLFRRRLSREGVGLSRSLICAIELVLNAIDLKEKARQEGVRNITD